MTTWLLISGKFCELIPYTKIDSSRGENIRDTTSIPAQVHPDDTALGASFLSKICNLEEAILRDRDCERRSRNNFAF